MKSKYKVPILDMRANYLSIKPEIDEAISKVVSSGHYILGDHVAQFEEEAARYLGVKYAIGVASGTDALYLALRAAQPYGMIQTSTFTFIASAECVDRMWPYATAPNNPERSALILADIDLDTYNMKSSFEGAKIAVHLFGHPCDMNNFPPGMIIEDCAQAFGAEYHGRKVGSLSTAGCFSFYPSKILGCYGDGGLVATNDKAIYEKILSLRHHGTLIDTDSSQHKHDQAKYVSIYHGLNSRLDELQAAILSVKLKHVDEWISNRARIAWWYLNKLIDCEGIIVPDVAENVRHAWNYYTIRCKDSTKRDLLQQHLTRHGIESIIYFPVCIHQQPTFSSLYPISGTFPNAELAAKSCLSLPIYPELSSAQIEYVCKHIKEFFAKEK